MPAQVALLYSVVLGPGRRVVMSELRALADDLGYEGSRTVLATGNLVFDAAAEPRAIESALETAFEERFGRRIDIIVRPGAAWPGLLAGNPFPDASAREPSRVAARIMRTPAGPEVLSALRPYRSGDERLALAGGDLWGYFPHGQGSSRLAAAITPARAGGVGTFRNWNTLRKIGALLETRGDSA